MQYLVEINTAFAIAARGPLAGIFVSSTLFFHNPCSLIIPSCQMYSDLVLFGVRSSRLWDYHHEYLATRPKSQGFWTLFHSTWISICGGYR